MSSIGERMLEQRAKTGKTVAKAGVDAAVWADDRFTLSRVARNFMNKIFPDHWSFLLGEIALYSFVVLVATGVFLTLYFNPSTSQVVYHGAYKPLQGQRVSEAYASTVDLSFSVRFGLLMRQMHHWAATVFVGAIVVHMCRIFFTGAFRRPRELNWIIGTTLLILAILNGFIGYSLPDDLISGTGIRIAFSILLSIPVVGSYLAFFLFGGNFPGDAIIGRFYVIHILILPAIIAALIGAHLGLMVYQKHTQFPGKGATERNVVGSPAWPNFAFKTGGFFFIITGGLALLGGLAQINPIWLYGSYVPYKVSYAVQPDWYMGWLDGALRIMPSWEVHLPGHMIPNVFFPAVLLPGLTFTLIILWPFLERFFTKDRREHHLLDRPRERPLRTSLGAGVLAFYFVLFGASSTDVLANTFHVSLNLVLWTFRIITIVIPPIVAWVTYRICLELSGTRRPMKRKTPNIVVRTATGRYYTVPAEVRPGDEEVELEPEELPSERPLEPVGVGAGHDDEEGPSTGEGRGEGRGEARAGDGQAAEGAAAGAPPARRSGGGGVFRVPRRQHFRMLAGGLFGLRPRIRPRTQGADAG
jgi:ubiquinol-cytochrome c reductase cytochrome b subunit